MLPTEAMDATLRCSNIQAQKAPPPFIRPA